jgi:hypothetical protein
VLTNLLRSSSGIQPDSGVYGQTGTRRRSGVVQDTGFADLIEELGVEVADEGADLAELVRRAEKAMNRQRSTSGGTAAKTSAD